MVGLGNPGKEYVDTRHNVGFRVLDRLAELLGHRFKGPRHEALFAETSSPGGRAGQVIWVKPLTFMNESGRAVRKFVEEFEIAPENLLVVVDDLDLSLGQLRIRKSGSAGGHRGLESLERVLGSRDYPRLRVGIGRPPGRADPADWVLAAFGKDEREEAEVVEIEARDAVVACLRDGLVTAMNGFNHRNTGDDRSE